jgi:hypothetical protein
MSRSLVALASSLVVLALLPNGAAAHDVFESDRFRQLDALLPTPNVYRTASGAPGHEYWQQRVDYDIEARLDEERFLIEGRARIDYHNQSPDTLRYLWLLLDQNKLHPEAPGNLSAPSAAWSTP